MFYGRVNFQRRSNGQAARPSTPPGSILQIYLKRNDSTVGFPPGEQLLREAETGERRGLGGSTCRGRTTAEPPNWICKI